MVLCGEMTNVVSNERSFGRTMVGSEWTGMLDYYSITNKDISHNTINNNAVENELPNYCQAPWPGLDPGCP